MSQENPTAPIQIFDYSTVDLSELSSRFTHQGYVILRNFITQDGFKAVLDQVGILEAVQQRRDLKVSITGDTWRKMWIVNGATITENAPFLAHLCRDEELRIFLSEIAGEDVYLMEDFLEYAVCNFLTGKGDVHGAHFDAFPYSFTIYIHVPHPSDGGQLEIAPGIQAISQFDTAKRVALDIMAGDCLFMNSGSIAHGVSPLHSDVRRTVFNVAFVNNATRTTTSPTRRILYDDSEY